MIVRSLKRAYYHILIRAAGHVIVCYKIQFLGHCSECVGWYAG